MSRGRESTYYEIALTQRQVVVAFVILLVCLVTAFFSGVWVGTGGSLPAQAEASAGVAEGGDAGQAAPPQSQVPADDEPEAEGGLATLRFFSESGEPTALAPAGGEPGEAPPPRPRQLPALEKEPEARATPPPQSSPTPGPEPRAEPSPRPAQPTASPTARTVPAPPPEPVAVPPGEGGMVIQVFSSHDQAQAQKLLDRLLRADFDAFLSPAEVAGVVRYRVRVGPFQDREAAEIMAERLRQDFKLETWITR